MPFCSSALRTPRCACRERPRRRGPRRCECRGGGGPTAPGRREGPPPGPLRRHHRDLEIAAGHVAEVRHDRGHRDFAVQEPGDAGLVAPAAAGTSRACRRRNTVSPAEAGTKKPRDRRAPSSARPCPRRGPPGRRRRCAWRPATRRPAGGPLRVPESGHRRGGPGISPRHPFHESESLNTARFSPNSRRRSRSRSAAQRVAGESWNRPTIIGARRSVVPRKCRFKARHRS